MLRPEDLGQGTAVELLHLLAGEALFGQFAGMPRFDKPAGVTPGEKLEDLGAAAADATVARYVAGEGGRDETTRRIGMPVLSANAGHAFARASPALDRFAPVEMMDQGPGAGTVVKPLGVPGRDEGVEGGVSDGEEELYVAVEVVAVTGGDHQRELEPVPRLAGRAGAVSHELDDCLLLRCQIGIECDALIYFLLQFRRSHERRWPRSELI